MNESDLRVIKTRENIESTFLKLLEEKDFTQITVAELVKECRISKGTFYYHYTDKYDLAEKIMRVQLQSYRNLLETNLMQQRPDHGPNFEEIVPIIAGVIQKFSKLSSIHTPEFDARNELNEFLSKTFLQQIENTTDLGIENPFPTSRMLAAIAVTEMEMVSLAQTEPGKSFLHTLNDLIKYIQYFSAMAD